MNRAQLRIIFCFLMFAPGIAGACDFCNCLMGINPNYNGEDKIIFHFLLQHSYYTPSGDTALQFGSKPAAGGYGRYPLGMPPKLYHLGGEGTEPAYETRQTFEIAYQHHFSDHIMATVMLPYAISDLESGENRVSVRGIGDPTLLAHYIITDMISPDIPATLLIGGGIKLPLGQHTLRDARGTLLDPRLQPGSGSVDVLANLMATAQFGSWTTALDAYGKINTTNGSGDRMGSSLALSATVNHDLLRSNQDLFAIVGIAGLREEMAGRDRIVGEIDERSGFTATYGSLGAQVVYGAVKLDMTVLLPLHQNRSSSEPMERPRILSGLRYEF